MRIKVVFFFNSVVNRSLQQVIREMTDGGVDRSIECTGNVDIMISAFECVHDVCELANFRTKCMN